MSGSVTGEVKNAIAHVRQDDKGDWHEHSLESHLLDVARISEQLAENFGAQDWAYLAGLWHDLGKYRPAFQSYIRKVSGYDPEAHIEQGAGRVDHSTAGAVYACKQGPYGKFLAYLIAGHHAGLPDWNTANAGGAALQTRLNEAEQKNYLVESLANFPSPSVLAATAPNSKPVGGRDGLHLWLRMLFSCLVDADFLDTEAFMSPDKAAVRGQWPGLTQLKDQFDLYMQAKLLIAEKTAVNDTRLSVLNDCRKAGHLPKGVFTLTVPTGGGKTLSAMAFALEHAIKHGLQRIIMVIPYTSIIEQTADQYRQIFGNAVLEHHSNLNAERSENSKSRLASENWDAPIIVTTNVQLLESLFAAKTSRCRKLHNIVNSVIIFDEAQLLPPEFLQPILDVLNLLNKYYSVSLVLSTATQPALNTRRDAHNRTLLRGFDNATEIITNVDALYKDLDRVKVSIPENLSERVSWQSIADELTRYPSVLAIVNTRKDCRTLHALMPKETIHLSALMCGEHRSNVIATIKKKLKAGEPVRVISTQLVEAGVDFDFPVVYRALAGLDSIAQAAGRCNREGKLEQGLVVVFVPPDAPPKGMLTFGEQATRSVWYGLQGSPLSHQLYRRYFEQYFGSADNDEKKINELLTRDAGQVEIQFRSVAEKFQLISDAGTHAILVPYDDTARGLMGMLRNGVVNRGILRRLQRYSVNVYENEFRKLRDIGAIEQLQLDVWAVCVSNAYDDVCGLLSVDSIYSGKPSDSVI